MTIDSKTEAKIISFLLLTTIAIPEIKMTGVLLNKIRKDALKDIALYFRKTATRKYAIGIRRHIAANTDPYARNKRTLS